MTAPDLGPCVCDSLADFALPHEHSDFDPYPCAEPACPCAAHRPADTKAEPGQDDAQTAEAERNRAPVRIPADALEFAAENVTQTATWIDSVLSWASGGKSAPDDPIPVCDFAGALEAARPAFVDTTTALAIALRRLAATQGDRLARRWVADIKRRVGRR